MLKAITNTEEVIFLAMLHRKEIEWHRLHSTFFCPVCRCKVIMKAGRKITPHFAHVVKSTCPSRQGGEGPYHERGKLLLYQWLKKQGLDVELEPYINEIHQRSDILVYIKPHRIAIEFQCATVGEEAIQKRNRGYRSVGIFPIWIVGANQFKRLQKHLVQLNTLTIQCMHRFTPAAPLTLYYFCPSTNQLLLFQHIFMTTTKKAFGKLTFVYLSHLKFKELFTYSDVVLHTLFSFWLKEKRSFRVYPRQLYGKEQKWQQWLYGKSMYVEQLPSVIHLPVTAQYLMKTPPWNWQSRLCLDVIHPLPIGKAFTLMQCKALLRPHLYSSHYFPLIRYEQDPIYQYLNHLVKLEIIIKTATGQYIKMKQFKFYRYVEEAVQGDIAIINELVSKYKK